MKRTQFLSLWLAAALILAGAIASEVKAQLLFPEIVIDAPNLPDEAKEKLAGVDSLLMIYLEAQEWARDDYQYDFPVQISIFVTEYSPQATEDKFKAKLIATNKQDVRLEDTRVEFPIKQPVQFRPNQYHALKSVVEFYVWILIGMEYDRLEKLGGAQYYEKAKQLYLEGSTTPFFYGWDRRIEALREITDDRNTAHRELMFFYYTGIHYDGLNDYAASKDYLYYALVKLDKIPIDVQQTFLEQNHRLFAEALVRAGYAKGVRALAQLDPQHKQIYDTIAPENGDK